MSRWSSRCRRAASLLLSVHLLQLFLLAASSACEPLARVGTTALARVGVVASTVSHAAMAHATNDHVAHHAHESRATTLPAPNSRDSHEHGGTPEGSCPVAMACSVTAVVTVAPTIITRTIIVPAPTLALVVTTPTSVRPAPDTPPPRA